jgi:hypothetical protein
MKEKLLFALAWALPAELVYYVGVRIVAHASVTKYRDTIMGDIPAAEAVNWWHESKVEGPTDDHRGRDPGCGDGVLETT